jgi:hypothetical protein
MAFSQTVLCWALSGLCAQRTHPAAGGVILPEAPCPRAKPFTLQWLLLACGVSSWVDKDGALGLNEKGEGRRGDEHRSKITAPSGIGIAESCCPREAEKAALLLPPGGHSVEAPRGEGGKD